MGGGRRDRGAHLERDSAALGSLNSFLRAFYRVVNQAANSQQHFFARRLTMSCELRRKRRQERGHALAELLARIPCVLERFVWNDT